MIGGKLGCFGLEGCGGGGGKEGWREGGSKEGRKAGRKEGEICTRCADGQRSKRGS